jgi:hypothetical protein
MHCMRIWISKARGKKVGVVSLFVCYLLFYDSIAFDEFMIEWLFPFLIKTAVQLPIVPLPTD